MNQSTRSLQKSPLPESEVLIEAARLRFYCEPVAIAATYLPATRKSHYLPAADTWQIVRMVAGRLLRQGMHPRGLLRSIGVLPNPRSCSDRMA